MGEGSRSWAKGGQGSGGDSLVDSVVGISTLISTLDGTVNTSCKGSKTNDFETHVVGGLLGFEGEI